MEEAGSLLSLWDAWSSWRRTVPRAEGWDQVERSGTMESIEELLAKKRDGKGERQSQQGELRPTGKSLNCRTGRWHFTHNKPETPKSSQLSESPDWTRKGLRPVISMDQNLRSPPTNSLHSTPLRFMEETTSVTGSAAAWFSRAGLVEMVGAPSMVPACVHVTMGLTALVLGIGPLGPAGEGGGEPTFRPAHCPSAARLFHHTVLQQESLLLRTANWESVFLIRFPLKYTRV